MNSTTLTAPIAAEVATPPAAVKKPRNPRMGLRTSATFATIFTILGHTVFGFEQSVAQVFVALLAGHSSALLFEWVDSRANNRTPGYAGGGWLKTVDFLLAPHMTSITMSFLLYVNQRLWVIALACVLAIGSKYVLRVKQNGRLQHFMNPSNFAIAIILVAYQWTGMLPWGYTVDLSGSWDWIVPTVIMCLGIRLNLMFTGRIFIAISWLITFIVLGVARAYVLDTPVAAQLVVLTGIPMVLFTLYMITDPQTSPSRLRSQFLFGGGIAVAYTVLLALQVQYTMFYCVAFVCAVRGAYFGLLSLRGEQLPAMAKVSLGSPAVSSGAISR